MTQLTLCSCEYGKSQLVSSVPLACVRTQSLSRVRFFVTTWTVAHQAPLSMGFPRQEYWSGLPFPSPGVLPDPEIESSCIASRFFTTKKMIRNINQ